jgi:hypothetical protein
MQDARSLVCTLLQLGFDLDSVDSFIEEQRRRPALFKKLSEWRAALTQAQRRGNFEAMQAWCIVLVICQYFLPREGFLLPKVLKLMKAPSSGGLAKSEKQQSERDARVACYKKHLLATRKWKSEHQIWLQMALDEIGNTLQAELERTSPGSSKTLAKTTAWERAAKDRGLAKRADNIRKQVLAHLNRIKDTGALQGRKRFSSGSKKAGG